MDLQSTGAEGGEGTQKLLMATVVLPPGGAAAILWVLKKTVTKNQFLLLQLARIL